MFTAVLILGGVGLAFAMLIAIANRRLKVWEDPRIDAVAAMLPNANCGACGLPGCRAFAEQAVAGTIQPARCTVSSEEGLVAIASYLGVDRGEAVKRVARLRCAGGSDVAGQRAEYRGLQSCAAPCLGREGAPAPWLATARVRLRRHRHECVRHPGGGP
jgi:Na+-translocating ferredoxin:NAD+ oxidoreductase RNF subunit RnfB